MEQKTPILYFCCSVNSRKSENALSSLKIALCTIEVQNLPQSFDSRCGFKCSTFFFTKDFALSLFIDTCETRGANQLISDPAWRTEQDPPDWGGGKGEILPVLGTSTGSNMLRDLNNGRVLAWCNGQQTTKKYYQYRCISDDEHVRNETRSGSGSGLCITGGSSLLTDCVLTDMHYWSLAI